MSKPKLNFNALKMKGSLQLTKTAWKIHPNLTAKYTKKLFYRPNKFHTKAPQKETLLKATEFEFESHGKMYPAWKWGSGPKVILLHGWAGRGIQFYKLIEALVEEGLQPITFDQPAHGNEAGTTNVYEFIQTTDDLIKTIDEVKLVVGHSMGSVPCLLLAKEFQVPTVLFAPDMTVKQGVIKMARHLGLYPKITQHLLNNLEKGKKIPMAKLSPRYLLKSLTNEVLIFHDEQDRFTSAIKSKAVSQGQAHITHVQSRGLGHVRILEDPETLSKAMTFIKEQIE